MSLCLLRICKTNLLQNLRFKTRCLTLHILILVKVSSSASLRRSSASSQGLMKELKTSQLTDARFLYSRALSCNSWCFLIPFKSIQYCHASNPFYSIYFYPGNFISDYILPLLLVPSRFFCLIFSLKESRSIFFDTLL